MDPTPWPALNYKELALLIDKIRPEVEGLFVDKVIVPERLGFPGGYVKGEWVLRLSGRRQERALLIGVRPRRPCLALCDGKGHKAAAAATHSPFDQAASKYLKGTKLVSVEAFSRERIAALWFEGGDEGLIGLIVSLIPAAPEAFLVRRSGATSWPILARSRTIRDESKKVAAFVAPDGSRAPPDVLVRQEWFQDPFTYFHEVESALKQEAFEERVKLAQKTVREQSKLAEERARQSEAAIAQSHSEPEYQRFADLLKASIYENPPIDGQGFRSVADYVSGETVLIPCDRRLDLREQVERFYFLARRKSRRVLEATTRLDGFREKLSALSGISWSFVEERNWSELKQVEQRLGLGAVGVPTAGAGAGGEKKRGVAWLGKTFVSRDGMRILVGRSRDENLELTFKHARGNDVWMHLRGRPGSHILIPTQTGKSVALETLLDAAVLTIYYSGGEKWGKTEVDYVFKKYVKRVKDSTEASYTHNRTLLVEPDSARLKRLLSQNS